MGKTSLENKLAINERGFTLLETIIALAIMVIAFASIISVESGSINAAIKSKQLNVVGMLAKNKMIDTEYEIEGKVFEEVKKEDSGAFPAPYEDYHWKTEVKEIKFPALNFSGAAGDKKGASASQAPAGQDMSEMMTKLVTQYLSKALREVSVTISWKKGSSDQKFSLSTYWVDLNHEFQLQEQ